MRIVDKPWGYEKIWAHTDRYVGKILHIERGHALSLQYHVKKEETILLQSGRMQLEHYLEGESPKVQELTPGSVFHITPGMRHRMIAVEDCDVLEVSTPELDDVIRLEDRYVRAEASPLLAADAAAR
jgi:mannose-6-phosphate isomerase